MFKKNNASYFLILFPLGIFIVFHHFLGFDGLYGQDAYAYLRYSKALYKFMIDGTNPGDYFWPVYYPFLGAVLSFVVQKTDLALQLISVFSLGVSAYYIRKILLLLFPKAKRISLYVFVFYVLSPYILKYSMTIMSDMLTVCFIVLSLFYFFKYKKEQELKFFYSLMVFSLLAVLTRYAGIFVVLPFILNALVLILKDKKFVKSILFGLIISGVVILPHLLFKSQSISEILSHPWLQNWSFTNFFKNSFTTVDGYSKNTFFNLFYAFTNMFSPRYIFTGLIFIPVILIKKFRFSKHLIILSSIVTYALFLAGIPFQNNRFLLLTFPLIVIIYFPVFNYLISLKTVKKYLNIILISVIITQSILLGYSFKSPLQRNLFEKEMVLQLKPFQHHTLYSFDIDIALQGRGLQFYYHNLWEKRYYVLKKGDLILFHPSKFNTQWQGKNPVLNFKYFTQNYPLTTVKELPNGWQLYKVN